MEIRKDYLAFGRPNFSEEEIEAVARVMRSGWVGMGPEVAQFEEELSVFMGAKHVVTLNSCTSALHLSLVLLGIGAGDEVIVPSLTWCSTANAALYLGAKPVFCDVDPETMCVTPELIKQKLTPKTKAVMVVHLAGLTVDIDAIRAALPANIPIVEDAAHALGSRYSNGKQVGSSGNLTCFSFYANKNLSTGEGGAIALNDDAMAERAKRLRQHGLPADAWKRFTHATKLILTPVHELGYKMNYTDLQACIGRVQLRRQAEFAERRLVVAKKYYDALHEHAPAVAFQADCLSADHARHLFLIKLPLEKLKSTRDEILLALRARNVGATVHYTPLHKMELYEKFGVPKLPATERICDRILTLPISASMTSADADYVCGHFKDVFK
jgi:perosamine synthetase